MSSLNALKYKVSVKRSYYAGCVILLLFVSVIFTSLLLVKITPFSLLIYLALLGIALMASQKAYLQQNELLFSESGELERLVFGERYLGKIGVHSFYNGLFIVLQLDIMASPFADKCTKQFITIYKDAISEEEYYLIARLINSGRN